jgi:hypothetical protein
LRQFVASSADVNVIVDSFHASASGKHASTNSIHVLTERHDLVHWSRLWHSSGERHDRRRTECRTYNADGQ